MSDNLHTWLEERETIHGMATEGPWVYTDYGVEAPEPPNPEDRFDILTDVIARTELKHEDTLAIVDAHNTLPKLLEGVKAVLELHGPEVSAFGGNEYCGHCRGEGGYLMRWPCDTYRALQEAINDEQ